MTLVERVVRLPNDVRLPFVEQGDPNGTPVLFVHAVADSWRSFELVLAELPDTIRAIAPTMRGHGDASRPDEGYTPDDFAGDLITFMDALQIERAVLVGGSSGGLVVRRVAINRPDRVAALVVLGSPFALHDKPAVMDAWASTYSKLEDPIDPVFVRSFNDGITVRAVPDAFLEAMVRENLKAPASVWKQTMQGLIADRSEKELGSVEAPALIVWGDADPLLSREDQERYLAALPHARLVVYSGVGHVPYWEEPERVARDIAVFVAGINR